MLRNLSKIIASIIIIISIIFVAYKLINNSSLNNETKKENTIINEITSKKEEVPNKITDFSVSKNGWLKVNDTKLLNEKGQEIQLTGISSHGIKWFGDLVTYDNLKCLKESWGINVFRVSMYSQNYIENPSIKQTLVDIVDNAINLDMYVIIDWHILFDSNPNTYIEQSNSFFDEMSLKYANNPNVIYEICNEPNGNAVTWEKEIKPYAQRIIPTIRNNSPKSLIIVGTPDWCKKLKVVADNPLNFENITYACHFYSGTHGQELQETIDYALNKNISIFISECGLTDASGNGQLYMDKFDDWIEFLNKRNISWIVWSFSNKNESSAILKPDYTITNNNNNNNKSENNVYENLSDEINNVSPLNINDYLSESGQYLKNLFVTRKNN